MNLKMNNGLKLLLALSLSLFTISPSEAIAQRGVRAASQSEVIKNLPYQNDEHPRHQLDLYLPKDQSNDGKRPVIVWIHGGGWRAGSKDGGAPALAKFMKEGFVVACINYRLSTEVAFPAQILDCKSAIRWLRANSEKYNLDNQRFGVFGSSAGGHLAALVGTSGDVSEFDKGLHLDQSSRVQAVCDFYGPTDFSVFVTTPGFESHAGPRAPEALLMGGTIEEKPEVAKLLNPITHVSEDDPSFLIVHGTKDATVPLNQSQLMYEALEKNKTAVHLHQLEGAGHGGPAFASDEVSGMVIDFFVSQLKSSELTNSGPAKKTEAEAEETSRRQNANQQRSFSQFLDRLDRDGNGKLSKDEVPNALRQQGRFERLDTNGDGELDESEHEAFMKNRQRPDRGQNRRNPAGRE